MFKGIVLYLARLQLEWQREAALRRSSITVEQSHHFYFSFFCFSLKAVSCQSMVMENKNSPQRTLLSSSSSSEYAAPSIQLAWKEETHFVTGLLLRLEQRSRPVQEMIHWYQAESQTELAEDHRELLASGWVGMGGEKRGHWSSELDGSASHLPPLKAWRR